MEKTLIIIGILIILAGLAFVFSQSRKFMFTRGENQIDLTITKLLFGYTLSSETITDITDIDYVKSTDDNSTFMVSVYSREYGEWVNLLGVYMKKTPERNTLINNGKRFINDSSASTKELTIDGLHYILFILVLFIIVLVIFNVL